MNSEFVSQWETFLNTVEARIRREIGRNGRLDSKAVNAIVEREVAKWSQKDHYNGAWLRKLTRQYPIIGEQYQRTLQTVQLDQSNSFKSTMPIVECFICAALLFITYAITSWLDLGWGRQLMVMIAIALAIIPILVTLATNRNKKRVDAYIEQIREQLERMGERLKSIVVSTEQFTQ